jgi:hypothetical protein
LPAGAAETLETLRLGTRLNAVETPHLASRR